MSRSVVIAALGGFCAGHLAETAFPVLSDWFSTAAGVTALILCVTAARTTQPTQTQEPR